MTHIPVLLKESVDLLGLHDGDIFVDGTVGSGGHSEEVAKRFPDIEIVAIDRDIKALERSEERLRTLTHGAYFRLSSFKDLDKVLTELGMTKVNAILLDLGISSEQIEESGRGFSFTRNEPLSMRMSEEGILSAKEILNTWDEDTLELILRGFGEEKYSRKIAREIVIRRGEQPFETTEDLVEAVLAATPAIYHRGRIHPATRTFQSLRIAVNEELVTLEKGLEVCFNLLYPKGRLCVISFHSLEDRIVKNFFRDLDKSGKGQVLTKKPIVPTEREIEDNPRSRSAKLRGIEKIHD